MFSKLKIMIIGLLALWGATSSVYAYGEYYVEVGSEVDENTASEKWRELADKYPDTLGTLQFFPTTVVRKQNNRVTTRIQAGPLEMKLDAYRICGKLFEDNVPCFVVEGMNHRATASAPVRAKPQEPLPWLVETNKESTSVTAGEVQENAAPEEQDFFSWVASGFESDGPAEAQIQAKELKPKRRTKVEVAEAIRVPYSPYLDETPTVAFSDDAPDYDGKLAFPRNASTTINEEQVRWLSVGKFESVENAVRFWKNTRRQEPVSTSDLKVHMIKPLGINHKADVSMQLGPFSSGKDAQGFCQNVIRKNAPALSCNYLSTEEARKRKNGGIATRYSHASRYETRRNAIHKRNGRSQPYSVLRTSQEKVYWLHVANAKNQMEALRTWDGLRKQHADLLDGLRSSVSATLSNRTRYVLRIGPLESSAAATELCGRLVKRGVFCKIYANM